MKGGTFGGARLPLQSDNTNDAGFPPVITDAGITYVFKYAIPRTRATMKQKARYVEKHAWGKPQSLILSMREAYLLA